MERLQAAVEKAREQRRGRIQDGTEPGAVRLPQDLPADLPPADPATDMQPGGTAPTDVAAPTPQPAPVQAARVRGRAGQQTGPQTGAWKALRPLEIEADLLRRNRLVSLDGGAEAAPFDLLRTKIIQQTALNNWRRVAIVSPHGGCGKTTTAANLAFSFARQRDLRTMFLDLDLRRPQLGQVLGQTSRFTMADVLEERVTFAEHGNRYGEHVAFGFNSEPVRNPSEILQSQRTQDVLGTVEAAFGTDLMLFDMPPMLGSDDNFGFLKNVDCALLVVAAEKTPMDHIDVVERQLADLTNVLGVVLNKCNYTDGAYGYDYA